MTVKELKELLEFVDDGTQIIVPLNAGDGFDGMFFSPCIEESGVGEVGLEEDDEDRDPIINPAPTGLSFLLVPCGFFQEKEYEVPPELN